MQKGSPKFYFIQTDPPKLSSEGKKVLDAIQKSETLEEAGNKLGVTKERVRQLKAIFVRRGFLQKHKPYESNRSRRRKTVAVFLYTKSKKTVTEIAQDIGISRNSVSAILRKEGVKLDDRDKVKAVERRTVITDQQILDALKRTKTRAEAARFLDTNPSNLTRRLRKLGVPIRKKAPPVSKRAIQKALRESRGDLAKAADRIGYTLHSLIARIYRDEINWQRYREN